MLAILYSINLIISGQYHPYQYMPFAYFSLLSFGYFFKDYKGPLKHFSNIIIIIVIISLCSFVPKDLSHLLTQRKPLPSRNGSVDRMIAVLDKYAKPADLIQPIDWIRGGTVHAMLNKKMKIATPFICDNHFKHHLHEKSTHVLIDKFFLALKRSSPRFILESLTHVFPEGKYTTPKLPEKILDYIENNYNKLHVDEAFILYQKN